MTRVHSTMSAARSENWPHYSQLGGRLPPALPDAIVLPVMYTVTVHNQQELRRYPAECTGRHNDPGNDLVTVRFLLHERKHTITRHHRRIRKISDPVICRTSTDPCRVYTIQIHITKPPWLSMKVQSYADWRNHRPAPCITNCSLPQHTNPPVSGHPIPPPPPHTHIVTGNRSPSLVSPETNKRGPHLPDIKPVQTHQSEHLQQPIFPDLTRPVVIGPDQTTQGNTNHTQ